VSDVIHRVLEVEREARRIIEQAEEQAAHITDGARQEARKIGSQIRQEAQQEADEIVRTAREKCQERKEQRLAEELEDLPSVQDIDEQKVTDAVEFIVQTLAPTSAEQAE